MHKDLQPDAKWLTRLVLLLLAAPLTGCLQTESGTISARQAESEVHATEANTLPADKSVAAAEPQFAQSDPRSVEADAQPQPQPEPETADPRSPICKIQVSPPEALLSINQRPVEQTPDGSYEMDVSPDQPIAVTVTLPGWTPWSRSFKMDDRSDLQLFVALQRDPHVWFAKALEALAADDQLRATRHAAVAQSLDPMNADISLLVDSLEVEIENRFANAVRAVEPEIVIDAEGSPGVDTTTAAELTKPDSDATNTKVIETNKDQNETLPAAAESALPDNSEDTETATAVGAMDISETVALGQQLIADGSLDEAVKSLTQTAREANSVPAELYYLLAVALEQREEYDKARRHYSNALDLNPRHIDALVNRSILLAADNRLDQALVDAEAVARLRPNDPASHNNLGVIKFRLKASEEAIEHFNAAIEIAPDYADAWFNRASVYAAGQQRELAIGDLEAVLELDPDHAEAKKLLKEIQARRASE